MNDDECIVRRKEEKLLFVTACGQYLSENHKKNFSIEVSINF